MFLYAANNISKLVLCIIILFGIGICLSLLPFSCATKGEWCGQDMDQYVDYSNNLLLGHGFTAKSVVNMYFLDPKTNTTYIPEIQRLPVFSVYISFLRLIVNDPRIILISNFFCYLGILVSVYLLLREFLTVRATLIAVLLCSINSSYLFYTALLPGVDTFVTVCTLVFVYAVYRLYRSKNNRMMFWLALVFGFGSLFSRQNTIIIILPLIIGLLGYDYKVRHKINKLLVYLVCFLCLSMALWGVRNYLYTNKFTLSAASGSQLFTEHILFSPVNKKEVLDARKNYVESNIGPDMISEAEKNSKSIPQVYTEYDSYMQKLMITYFIHNPAITFEHFQIAFVAFFTGPTFSLSYNYFLTTLQKLDTYIGFLLIIGLCIFPVSFFTRKKKDMFLLLLWFSVVCFCIISAFYHGIVIGSRGNMPVLPLELLFCFYTIQSFISMISRLYRKQL